MIEEIEVNNVAIYTEKQTLLNLKKVNFIYGANGSGKTTVSRILSNPEKYPDCNIKWDSPNELPILVYNKDFVDEHFSESETLKGVFTLGKDSIEKTNVINQKRSDLEKLIQERTTLERTLNGDDSHDGKIKELI